MGLGGRYGVAENAQESRVAGTRASIIIDLQVSCRGMTPATWVYNRSLLAEGRNVASMGKM